MGEDMGFARAFAIREGLFSHWQVWMGSSLLLEFIAMTLNRYGRGRGPG